MDDDSNSIDSLQIEEIRRLLLEGDSRPQSDPQPAQDNSILGILGGRDDDALDARLETYADETGPEPQNSRDLVGRISRCYRGFETRKGDTPQRSSSARRGTRSSRSKSGSGTGSALGSHSGSSSESGTRKARVTSMPSMLQTKSSQAGSNVLEHDTQPFPDTFYNAQSNSWIRSQDGNIGSSVEAGPSASIGRGSMTTPRSLQASNSGHINLVQDFQQQTVAESEEVDAEPESDGWEVSPNISQRHDSLPDHIRFQRPYTPATGKSRRSSEQRSASTVPTSAARHNPFGVEGTTPGKVMGLTQAFDQISSPISKDVLPDSLSDRPSPDNLGEDRTLDFGLQSTPTHGGRRGFQRAVTEPSSTYIPRMHSQRARAGNRSWQPSSTSGARAESPESGSEPGIVEVRNDRRRRRLAIDDELKETFAQVKALRPELPTSSLKRKRASMGDIRSDPDVARLRSDVDASKAPQPQQDLEDEENETECETQIEGSVPASGFSASNNSNTRATSTIDVRNSSQLIEATQPSPWLHGQRQAQIASVPLSSGPAEPKSTSHDNQLFVATQTTAIQDSQPSLARGEQSPLPSSAPNQLESSPTARTSLPLSQSESGQAYVQSGSSLPQVTSPTPQAASRKSVMEHGGRKVNKKTSSPNEPAFDSDRHSRQPSRSPTDEPLSPKEAHEERHHGRDSSFEGPRIANESNENQSNMGETSAGQKEPSTEKADSQCSTDHPKEEAYKTPRRPKARSANTTIPETSPPGAMESTPPSFSPREHPEMAEAEQTSDENHLQSVHDQASGTGADNSKSTSVFETAQTHCKPPPTKSQRNQSLSSSHPLQQLSQPRVRTLSQIAADPSPPDAAADIEVDFSLLSSADNEYHAAIESSSPVDPSGTRWKRRRGPWNSASSEELGDPRPTSQPQDLAGPTEEGSRRLSRGLLLRKPDRGTPNEHASDTGASTRRTPQRGMQNQDVVQDEAPAPSSPDMPDAPKSTGSAKAVAPGKRTKRAKNARKSKKQKAKKPFKAAAEVPGPAQKDHSTVEETLPSAVELVSPNRVFALFRGLNLAYYPATYLSTVGTNGKQLRVRFDDGTIDTLEPHLVRSLDVRTDDIVKVDLPNMRTPNWVVSGFEDKRALPHISGGLVDGQQQESDEDVCPQTDIRGFNKVQLLPKRRQSIAQGQDEEATPIVVPMSSIYIVQSNWIRFRDRIFSPESLKPRPKSGCLTPLEQPSKPTTPSTRSRYVDVEAPRATEVLSISSVRLKRRSDLFEDMVFAVSYVDQESGRDDVSSSIVENGGRIVTEGFEELFHTDGLELSTESRFAAKTCDEGSSMLRLTSEAQKYGFACLIADHYSRKAKFVQALALGLPCVSGCWIQDCVSKGRVLDWEVYLLPAGESVLLGGAVRSRTLQPYPAASTRFASTIESRPKFLDGRSVLLVMGRGKAEERRKAYLFLTYALGATMVGRVPNIETAKQELDDAVARDNGWDWVYVDGNVATAKDFLLSAPAAGRKRKRPSLEEARKENTPDVRPPFKIVDNEFVVQSLILGRLLED